VDILEFDANIDSKYQLPDKLIANSWDMKTQKLLTATAKKPSLNKWGDLDGGKLSDVIGLKELQTSSSAPIPKEVLQEWSNGRLLKSRLASMHGKVTFHGNADVKIGTLLDIAGMGKHFNGTAYISGIDHDFQNGMWTTTARFGLDPKWFVETRPEVSTLNTSGVIPAIKGLQTGVVKQIEEDPDGEHRILVDIPVVEDSGKGVWARLTHLYASKGIGFFFMPEVGDEVVLGFLNDDPRYPIIVGMMYSSKLAPAETATKDNFIKSITTKEKMKITFDEEKKIITIETPGKNTIVMDDDKKAITLTDANKNVVALDDKGISLTTKKDITIDAKGKVTLGGQGGVAIASKGGNVTMEGISIESKAKMAVKAEGKMLDLKGSVQANLEGAIVTIN
ncbi:MAG: phage baseplate assembly protein V, partial [Bacteroidota bacterium]